MFEHPGARDVVRREDFVKTGTTTVREALNRVPGVVAPENNGTGSHDMALNFGIRGLNPRLASRSTVLMDGIPVPFAPYGQPQLSLAPVSLGNMDAIDVVRGGGAVRYGPQSVGGVVNFVTRAIPKTFGMTAGMQGQLSPTSRQDHPKGTGNLMIGGTADNGFGAALLYSGTRGSDWREHSSTKIDDVMLKSRYAPNEVHTFNSLLQYYEGEAEMPGGLSRADYNANPFQSTRPYDKFWGRRQLANFGYQYQPDQQHKFDVQSFYTYTLRSGYLDQGKNLTLSPREYWVRGVEPRYSQSFRWGDSAHEVASATVTSANPPTSCATTLKPAPAGCRPPPARTIATPSQAPRRTRSISTIASTSATGPSRRACVTNTSSRIRTTTSRTTASTSAITRRCRR